VCVEAYARAHEYRCAPPTTPPARRLRAALLRRCGSCSRTRTRRAASWLTRRRSGWPWIGPAGSGVGRLSGDSGPVQEISDPGSAHIQNQPDRHVTVFNCNCSIASALLPLPFGSELGAGHPSTGRERLQNHCLAVGSGRVSASGPCPSHLPS
jgi:hypothetical protein